MATPTGTPVTENGMALGLNRASGSGRDLTVQIVEGQRLIRLTDAEIAAERELGG